MNTEPLYPLWARIGVNFPAFEPSREEPLVEELIAQTSVVGRYEPRLIEAMAGWIQKHGDLINTAQLHKHISTGDSAVIGLVLDLVTSKQAMKLKTLQRRCTPKEKPEMLFYTAETSPTLKAQAVENEAEINRKWNIYYVSLRLKTDAVLEKKGSLEKKSEPGSKGIVRDRDANRDLELSIVQRIEFSRRNRTSTWISISQGI